MENLPGEIPPSGIDTGSGGNLARIETLVSHTEEGFSDDYLEGLNKGITTQQQGQAAKILKQLKILLYASFVVNPAFSREDFQALRRYIRRLDIQHASFAVLTPFPGTQLYAERKADLLSEKPEHFDLLHSLLPTTLPLQEFYTEFAGLYRDAIPLKHSVRTLAKYGLRGASRQMRLVAPALKAIRNGYLDH